MTKDILPKEDDKGRPADEPDLMRRMAVTLDSDHLLKGIERKLAAERCHECTDLEACRVWLDITAIRGAPRAPKFCRNCELFDDLANEVARLSF